MKKDYIFTATDGFHKMTLKLTNGGSLEQATAFIKNWIAANCLQLIGGPEQYGIGV